MINATIQTDASVTMIGVEGLDRRRAEDQKRVGGDGDGIGRGKHRAKHQVTAEQPSQPGGEALDRKSIGPGQRRQVQRRLLDVARGQLPGREHGERAGLDREHQNRAARRHQAERAEERGERERLRQQRPDQRGHHLPVLQPQQIRGLGADEQHDQQHASGNRHRQQRVEDRVGDELYEHHRPIGRRDEGTPLE